MTSVLERSTREVSTSAWRPSRVQLAMAVLAVLGRLPFLSWPLAPDEAGFLAVARQWHHGGGSLYGGAWVDRPPLLIGLFGLADRLGGAVPLRLVGCVAVVVTVLATSQAVRVLVDDGRVQRTERAVGCTALVAAALLCAPVAGARTVNGELLAAPFVALGLLALAVGLRARTWRTTIGAGVVGGASAAAALLVKQNMVDVLVLTAVVGLVAVRAGVLSPHRARTWLAGAAPGFVVTAAGVLAVAWLRGTSPGGVLWAMYPFRVEAGHVLATSTSSAAHERGWALLSLATVSGVLPVVAVAACVLVAVLRHGRPDRRPGALHERDVLLIGLAWVAWCGLSIAAGGSFWSHYLVQAAPAVALLAGAVALRHRRLGAGLATAVAAVAVVSVLVTATTTPNRWEQEVGSGIGRAAEPGDTVMVVWGHANLLEATGLRSPYPYWWSLPTKTLDPRLTRMNAVLTGPDAPTWFVVGRHLPTWGLDTSTVAADLAHRYRLVTTACGSLLYLRDDVNRPVPIDPCSSTSTPQEKS